MAEDGATTRGSEVVVRLHLIYRAPCTKVRETYNIFLQRTTISANSRIATSTIAATHPRDRDSRKASSISARTIDSARKKI